MEETDARILFVQLVVPKLGSIPKHRQSHGLWLDDPLGKELSFYTFSFAVRSDTSCMQYVAYAAGGFQSDTSLLDILHTWGRSWHSESVGSVD